MELTPPRCKWPELGYTPLNTNHLLKVCKCFLCFSLYPCFKKPKNWFANIAPTCQNRKRKWITGHEIFPFSSILISYSHRHLDKWTAYWPGLPAYTANLLHRLPGQILPLLPVLFVVSNQSAVFLIRCVWLQQRSYFRWKDVSSFSTFVGFSVTRLGDLLDFGQLFKAFGNS